jgi:uncharacterized protein (TIGR02217 family)
MTFHDVLLDKNYSYGGYGGPAGDTAIVTGSNGIEARSVRLPNGRVLYNISYSVLTREQIGALIAFYRLRAARGYSFRFLDPFDYNFGGSIGAWEPLINPGGTTLQLTRTYSDAAATLVRPITKPDDGTFYPDTPFALRKNGVIMVSGWTLDRLTGVITLSTAAPGSTFEAQGEFHVPVRFDFDEPQFSEDEFDSNSFGASSGSDGFQVVEVINE